MTATSLADRTADDVGPRLLRDTNLFVPEGERHIDGTAAAYLLASLLGNALLAALVKEVASRSVGWVAGRLGHLFDKAPPPLPPDIAAAAEQGAASLAGAGLAERVAALVAARAALVAELSKSVPSETAEKVVATVADGLARHAG